MKLVRYIVPVLVMIASSAAALICLHSMLTTDCSTFVQVLHVIAFLLWISVVHTCAVAIRRGNKI